MSSKKQSKLLKNSKGETFELNPTTQSGMYIGMLSDTLGRSIGIADKKLGISNYFFNRLMQLSNTKSPIQLLFIKMFVFEGAKTAWYVEQMFKSLLNPAITEGEYVDDKENWFVTHINIALDHLKQLGVKWEEVWFADDEQLSTEVKNTIKSETSHIYWPFANIPDTDNSDPKYSVWLLKTPSGEEYIQLVTIDTTRAYNGNKKLTPELAMNYCNANNFLRSCDYNHTKLTATMLSSSNNKDEINSFCLQNNFRQFSKDYKA